jgi:hypothetical protein
LQVFRAVQANEMAQRMNRCQSLIERRRTTPSCLFQVPQKRPNPLGGDVVYPELIDPSPLSDRGPAAP